jgi:tetratricopeptide (TPR) repeat protein
VQTLYELLGALPDDDADRLRAAFSSAAKASHPDNNPDDPDAPQRFRRVVRAYAILRDERQRRTYDSLLVTADQQRTLDRRHKVSSRIQSLVPHPIVVVAIAFMSIGAFYLIGGVLRAPDVPMRAQQSLTHVSALAAAMPATPPSDTIGRAGERNRLDRIPVSGSPEAADAVEETMALGPPAAASSASTVQAISDVEVKDAKYYRERGQQAYRIGDLALALVDLDLAVELDPDFSDAYIDRAIVFHRMGDLKRAFADIAEARRVDGQKPQQTARRSGNN